MLSEVMDHFGFNEQEFMMMQATYMQNPATQQPLMQAQFAPTGENAGPKLERQKTKEIFMDSEQEKMDSMKKMLTAGGAGQDPNMSEMDAMMSMMVEQAKITDKMYFKHGVDEDDFNQSVMFHNLMQDPEVMRMMQ